MNRRDMLVASATLLAAPLARAQTRPAGGPFRIGLLPDLPTARHEQIIAALRELDWVHGRDFILFQSEVPQGRDVELSARRVVEGKPDLIFAANTAYILAAYRLTKTVPIVMWTSGYPVESGLAYSLANPGKNVTGLSIYAGTEIFGKLLQLLVETKPGIKRIGVLWSYVPPAHPREEIEPAYAQIRSAAQSLRLDVRIIEISKPEETQTALATVRTERMQALMITAGWPLFTRRQEVMNFVVEKGIPTVADWEWLGIEPQPLLRYSPLAFDLIRQASLYVDKILKGGAKAGNLPIQQPAKFELVVNLKTARKIGIKIPQSILLRADRVIE